MSATLTRRIHVINGQQQLFAGYDIHVSGLHLQDGIVETRPLNTQISKQDWREISKRLLEKAIASVAYETPKMRRELASRIRDAWCRAKKDFSNRASQEPAKRRFPKYVRKNGAVTLITDASLGEMTTTVDSSCNPSGYRQRASATASTGVSSPVVATPPSEVERPQELRNLVQGDRQPVSA